MNPVVGVVLALVGVALCLAAIARELRAIRVLLERGKR